MTTVVPVVVMPMIDVVLLDVEPRLFRHMIHVALEFPELLIALQRFELMQYLITVERADVLGLDRGELANRPAQVHEMRLDRMRQRMHADLFRKAIALPGVAGAAGCDDVRPIVRAAA